MNFVSIRNTLMVVNKASPLKGLISFEMISVGREFRNDLIAAVDALMNESGTEQQTELLAEEVLAPLYSRFISSLGTKE